MTQTKRKTPDEKGRLLDNVSKVMHEVLFTAFTDESIPSDSDDEEGDGPRRSGLPRLSD